MANETTAADQHIPTGARVRVYGQLGTITYRTRGGTYYGVQLDGETRIDEWQPCQIEVLS
jgi:hypothetical protein